MNHIVESYMVRLQNGFLSSKNAGYVFQKHKDKNTVVHKKGIKERKKETIKKRRDFCKERKIEYFA